MAKYVLLEVTGAGGYEVVPHQGAAVRLVCEGSAAQCGLSAIEDGCRSADIHDIRLYQLPSLQRRVAIGERNARLESRHPEPAEAAAG